MRMFVMTWQLLYWYAQILTENKFFLNMKAMAVVIYFPLTKAVI